MAAADPARRRAVARVAANTRWTRARADRLVAAREELENMPSNCPSCGQGKEATSAYDRRAGGKEVNECPRCGMHRPSVSERLAEQVAAHAEESTTPEEATRDARLYEYNNQLHKMRMFAKRTTNTPEEIALARRERLRPGDLDAAQAADEEPESKGPDPQRVSSLARRIRPTLDQYAQEEGRWTRRDARELLEGYTDDPDLTRAVVAHLRSEGE